MLYTSLVGSYLTYDIVVWGKYSITFGNKVQAMQNRIMKSIIGSYDQHIHKSNGLLNFEQSYMYFAVIKLYKEINIHMVTGQKPRQKAPRTKATWTKAPRQ